MAWSQTDEAAFQKLYGKPSTVSEQLQFKKAKPYHGEWTMPEGASDDDHPFVPRPRSQFNRRSNTTIDP